MAMLNVNDLFLTDLEIHTEVSVRLSNCLKRARLENSLPFETVGEYMAHDRNSAKYKLKALPQFGTSSYVELVKIIDKIVESPPHEINTSDKNYNIKLAELPKHYPTSYKLGLFLQNFDSYNLPFSSVGDLLNYGNRAYSLLKKVDGYGNTTFEELKELLIKVKLGDKEAFDIDEDILQAKIIDLVISSTDSIRLINAIKQASHNDALPAKNIDEYLKLGKHAIRLFKKIENLGNNSAIKLDRLINDIVNGNKAINNTLNIHGDTNTIDQPISLIESLKKLLNEKQFDILYKRSVDKLTLEEIGIIYEVTRERIRQIEKSAIIKIVNFYKDDFKKFFDGLLEILDSSGGFINTSDFIECYNLKSNEAYLILYILKQNSNKAFYFKENIIFDSKFEANKKDWGKEIDEELYNSDWPINYQNLLEKLSIIPNAFVETYLYEHKEIEVHDGLITSIKKIPRTVMATYAIRMHGAAITPKQASSIIYKSFGVDINEHNTGSILARMENALIVDRGLYSLYELLPISNEKVEQIRNLSNDYLYKKQKFISAKVIHEDLFTDISEWTNYLNSYVLLGILQDDCRFISKRGLMVGLAKFSSNVRMKPLNQEIYECIRQNGESSAQDIKELLSTHRNLLHVTITMMLDSNPEIIQVSPGRFDFISNVYPSIEDYTKLGIASQIAIACDKIGLLSLTKKLKLISAIEHIQFDAKKLRYLLKKITSVRCHNDVYHCVPSRNIINYLDHIESNHAPEYVLKKAQSDIRLDANLKKYIELDYRFYNDAISQEKSTHSELSSIFGAFNL